MKDKGDTGTFLFFMSTLILIISGTLLDILVDIGYFTEKLAIVIFMLLLYSIIIIAIFIIIRKEGYPIKGSEPENGTYVIKGKHVDDDNKNYIYLLLLHDKEKIPVYYRLSLKEYPETTNYKIDQTIQFSSQHSKTTTGLLIEIQS